MDYLSDLNSMIMFSLLQLQEMITMVIGPRYKPFCLIYDHVTSSARRPASLGSEYMCTTQQRPVAFDRELFTVAHYSLEDSLHCLGGINLLLYMFARVS